MRILASSLFIFGFLESQRFVKPTNPLLGTYVPPCATKTMHICICPNQCGCDKMNQALVPPIGPQLLYCFLWFETNPHIQILNPTPKPLQPP